MPYFKVRTKSLNSPLHVWMVVEAQTIYRAELKARDRCSLSNRFCVLENTIEEISQYEYEHHYSMSGKQLEH